MRERAKRLVVLGLDRALAARFESDEVGPSREEVIDWARLRLRGLARWRGVVAGLQVVVTRPGRAELRPLEVSLPGPAEVTVELLASAVSPGTERAQWLRLPNARPQTPFVPGYSGAGRVLAAGRDVEGLEEGTPVAVPRAKHASVATVPADWVSRIPPGVRMEEAALVYLGIIAGYGVRRAGALAGRSVCLVGAGPIGALAHRLSLLDGPAEVTVVATSRRREAAALRAGADRFLTRADDAAGIQADVVIEATGDPGALRTAASAARPGGAVVLLGSPRGETPGDVLGELQRKGLRLVGAHVSALATEARRAGGDPFAELSHTYLDALAGGLLQASDLAGQGFDPREIGILYRSLAQGTLTGAYLDWARLPRPERVRRRLLASPPALPARARPVRPEAPAEVRATSRPLRFSVVGCGDIGLSNAGAIASAANAELVACHDAAPGLADAAVQRHGGKVAPTLEEALDPGRVDAVFLSVPHDLHAPLAIRAAEAGLHVVVEKPLAADLPAARDAAAAAAAAGVAMSVCFSFRYEQVVQTALSLVQAGALGSLRGVAVSFHADKPASYWTGGFSGRAHSGWRASRARAGGGVLIMNLTHYVDLVRYVTGVEPEWVAGVSRTDPGAEVEDAVALSVGFAGGAVGSFTASASTQGSPPSRFEIWGDAGTLRLEPDPAIYTERAVGGAAAGTWSPLGHDARQDLRRIFVERFADAVLDGRPPEVEVSDALSVQAFLDAAYRAIEDGRPVAIEASEA